MPENDQPGASQPQPAPGGFVPPALETLQAMLPQYEMLAIIGIGGMGAVYKARQKNLDRLVAIKVLPKDTGAEYNFAERFQREAQAMAKLHHQRIVSVHDFGETSDNHLYIVMEFVEGTDLYHLIKTGALDQNQVLAIITQICDALSYAHEKGIVHRDIKPANIMLDVEGNVKVADFGLAKLTGGGAVVQTQLTMTNMAMGTPDYIAPEQLETGVEVDQRADIYSFGVMIYEMLTGAVPRGAFLPPSKKSTNPLDARLDEVVNTAMQTDPATRYQQVTQLWTDVDRIRTTPAPLLTTSRAPVMAGGTGKVQLMTGDTGKVAATAQPQPPAKPPADPAKTKRILLATLGTIAAAAFLGILGYFVFKPATPSIEGPDPVIAEASTPSISKPENDPTTRRRESEDALRKRSDGGKGQKGQKGQNKQARERANAQGNATPAPPPAQAPDPKPAPEQSGATQTAEGPIDLLAGLDLADDTVLGRWELVGGALQGTKDPSQEWNRSWIRLPAVAPDNYTFRASVTPVNASESTNLILPVADRQVELVFGAHRNHHDDGPMSGLTTIDGRKTYENETAVLGHALEKGRTYLVEVRVTSNDSTGSVDVDLDGAALIRWSGSVDALSANFEQFDVTPEPHRFLLGTYAGAVSRFSDLTLLPGDPSLAPRPSIVYPASRADTSLRDLDTPIAPPADAVEFAGNHYKYFNERLQWAAAAETARNKGGYLVSIHSKEENEFVRSLLPPNPPGQPWIGLRPQGEDQPWSWEDGTTTANYSHWKGGTKPAIAKPDGTGNRVSIRAYDGAWSIVSEGFSGPYLVEWGEPGNLPEPDNTTSIPAPQGDTWDLLAATDPDAHAIEPRITSPTKPPVLKWERTAEGITTASGLVGMLMPPVPIPASYDLELRILPRAQMAVTLPIGSRAGTLVFNKNVNPAGGGFELIDGMAISDPNNTTQFTGSPIKSGVESTILIQVRQKSGDVFSFEAFLNGKPLTSWEGNASSLTTTEHWTLPEPHRIGLGCFTSNVKTGALGSTWLSATLRPLGVAPSLSTTTTAAPETTTVPQTEIGKKIAALTAEYARKFNTTLGDAHTQGIAALNTSYAGALERAEPTVAASGDLDAILLFRNEVEAAKSAGTAPIATPLPANAPAQLTQMRQTYTTTVAQREQKRDADAAPLLRQFEQALDQLERDLTREQKIEDALDVRRAREQLKENGTAIFSGAAVFKTSGKWIPLFNGENLNNWNQGGNNESFRVDPAERILIFQGKQHGDLYYRGNVNGGSFTDFEFKAMVKTIEKANSGVYLHITPQTKPSAYEVQIANQNVDPQKTGSIWGVEAVERMHVRDGDWFELHIRVEGKTITVAIDGKTVNEYTDPGNGNKRLGAGSLMIQWSGGPSPDSAVHFKDIQIRSSD